MTASSDIPHIAIHEAGHAVVQFLIAPRLGFEPPDAVDYVDLEEEVGPPVTEPDGGVSRRCVAATVCEFWSAEIKAAARAAGIRGSTIDAARAAGADIPRWAGAKILQIVAGAAAEARARGVSFYEVWVEDGCSDDLEKAVCISRMAQWSPDKRSAMIDKAATALERYWSSEQKWRALLELAKTFPPQGRMSGQQCWETYQRALAQAAPQQ